MRSQEKLHLVPEGRDSRDEETNARMRVLWTILIVLVIALIAAIIYEIVLGNGLQQTGSERMEEIGREPVVETEPKNETRFMTEQETESAAERETAAEAEPVTEAESETQAKADPQKEIERIQNSRQSEGQDDENAPTLAGVGGL